MFKAQYPFGSTGHQSMRVIFGAAALSAMKQDKADAILDLLLEYGVNNIDIAAAYGDSELRIVRRSCQRRSQPRTPVARCDDSNAAASPTSVANC
jgi:aryl-alcohol dehydrogenase-like predicted oxidoreductase